MSIVITTQGYWKCRVFTASVMLWQRSSGMCLAVTLSEGRLWQMLGNGKGNLLFYRSVMLRSLHDRARLSEN